MFKYFLCFSNFKFFLRIRYKVNSNSSLSVGVLGVPTSRLLFFFGANHGRHEEHLLLLELVLLADEVVALVQLEDHVVAGKKVVAAKEALAQVLGLLCLQLCDDLADASLLPRITALV